MKIKYFCNSLVIIGTQTASTPGWRGHIPAALQCGDAGRLFVNLIIPCFDQIVPAGLHSPLVYPIGMGNILLSHKKYFYP